jgi:DNA-binding PadR family transcriptional regulator
MSKDDGARAAAEMKWLLLVLLQKRHANWHELTDDVQRALFDKAFEETMDEMVADGIFRCVGVTSSGRKIYRITEAGRSPHLIVSPPDTVQ